MSTEHETEAAIHAAGKTAPRLTPEHINNQIVEVTFHQHKHLTICILALRNGFFVTGESAPASAENFDVNIGRDIAYDNARKKIWALEGYQLRTKLAEREKHAERVRARYEQAQALNKEVTENDVGFVDECQELPVIDYTSDELKKIQADELRDQALKALDDKVADPFRAR